EILALSHSITQTHSYAVVLGEMNGLRRLPIVIGGFEAQAIAVALEKMQPSRPLTHDLFANFMQSFSIDLSEVIIYKLEEGIFFAKLVCQNADGVRVEIDSRTSDALALSVRAGCKIFTYESLLKEAGLFLSQSEGSELQKLSSTAPSVESTIADAFNISADENLKDMNLTELEDLLIHVLEQEDYVRAIQIRDEINKRK
ncbi:MAG TPA: bifunctional nuclease family protein, partial [Flavipsychrobacter sp.]|nr:bifunctional nuclease family protein [Flavipsychrobacter sp.]